MFSGLAKVAESIFKGIVNRIIDTINYGLRQFNNISDAIPGKQPKFEVIQRFARGGEVKGKGTGTSDSIPAMLSNGEFVVNAKSTQTFKPLLEALNNMGNSTSNIDNSTNININNNGNGGGSGFFPSFLLPS